MTCPLCQTTNAPLFHCDKQRSYFRCEVCLLVFVGENEILSKEEEKAVYDLHQNHSEDEGYQTFLGRIVEPLRKFLKPGAKGLDFGCGPNPVLAEILNRNGFAVDFYDPIYFPNQEKLGKNYDFITATEVIEHVKDPAAVFSFLHQSLKKNGVLGLMTKLVIDVEAFSRWHYKNDLTHIRFYSRETFAWLAKKWDWELEIIGKDVVLLKRKN